MQNKLKFWLATNFFGFQWIILFDNDTLFISFSLTVLKYSYLVATPPLLTKPHLIPDFHIYWKPGKPALSGATLATSFFRKARNLFPI